MSSEFARVDLNVERITEWDRFAASSSDAWFWHTTGWLDFLVELGRPRSCANHSFWIEQEKRIVAICPLVMEQGDGFVQFAYDRFFNQAPALAPWLSPHSRGDVLDFYFRCVRDLAHSLSVDVIRLAVPPLAPASLKLNRPQPNPFVRFGFLEESFTTQVIRLDADVTALWGDVRKGHKADVKRARKLCQVSIWTAETISQAKFDEYQALHLKDAGRMTRNQRTWDLMLEWIRSDQAVLAEASIDGTPIAFAHFIVYGNAAYYSSSCRDPESLQIPAIHLIQWNTMLYLKERGVEFYEIGRQDYGPEYYPAPTSKEVTISHFKRGFGGEQIRVGMAEYFFSPGLMERVMCGRTRNYLGRRDGAQNG